MVAPLNRHRGGSRFVLPRWSTLVRFAKDPEAPVWKKLLLSAVVFYIVFPADFVPDLVPFWGWLDDVGAASLGTLFLSWTLGPYAASTKAPGSENPSSEVTGPDSSTKKG